MAAHGMSLNRLNDIERADLINWLRRYGQEQIDENRDGTASLATKAKKELKFEVTGANIKKLLPKIGLRPSEYVLKRHAHSFGRRETVPEGKVGTSDETMKNLADAVNNLASTLTVIATLQKQITDLQLRLDGVERQLTEPETTPKG